MAEGIHSRHEQGGELQGIVIKGMPEQRETYQEAHRRLVRAQQAAQREKFTRTLNSPAKRHFDPS